MSLKRRSHFDLPATVYCWKNYYETSGHWNVNPPKTVRAVVFYRADDPVTAAAQPMSKVLQDVELLIRSNAPITDGSPMHKSVLKALELAGVEVHGS